MVTWLCGMAPERQYFKTTLPWTNPSEKEKASSPSTSSVPFPVSHLSKSNDFQSCWLYPARQLLGRPEHLWVPLDSVWSIAGSSSQLVFLVCGVVSGGSQS